MPNANRFGELRRSTLSWCRGTRISASNAARDRNSPIKAHQINVQRSLIGSEYQPIRGRSQPFWVCGRDRPCQDHRQLENRVRRQRLQGKSLPPMMSALLIADQLGVDIKRVTDEAHFTDDLGADWLDRLELMIVIEDQFADVVLTDEDVDQIEVVGDLVSP